MPPHKLHVHLECLIREVALLIVCHWFDTSLRHTRQLKIVCFLGNRSENLLKSGVCQVPLGKDHPSSETSPGLADSDNRYLRTEVTIINKAQHPPCMLLCLLLCHEPSRWPRDEVGSYEINSVIGHIILLDLWERTNAYRALWPCIWDGRPSLKCRQITSLVALNTYSRTKEKAGQNNPFNPTLRRQGSELVVLTDAAMGRQ